MLRLVLVLLCAVAILGTAGTGRAQIAGTTKADVGWSAKKSLLGKPVYNDANQKIGSVEDIIVTPEGSIPYAIVAIGGFVGLTKYDVAIHMSNLELRMDRIVLPGATKDLLKSLPEFAYAK